MRPECQILADENQAESISIVMNFSRVTGLANSRHFFRGYTYNSSKKSLYETRKIGVK